jgi:hypothetical protein
MQLMENEIIRQHNAAVQRHIDAGTLPCTEDSVTFMNCRRAANIPDPVLRITENTSLRLKQQMTALTLLQNQLKAEALSAKEQRTHAKLALVHKLDQRARRLKVAAGTAAPSPEHTKSQDDEEEEPAPSSIADLSGQIARLQGPLSPPPPSYGKWAKPRARVVRAASGSRKEAKSSRDMAGGSTKRKKKR